MLSVTERSRMELLIERMKQLGKRGFNHEKIINFVIGEVVEDWQAELDSLQIEDSQ